MFSQGNTYDLPHHLSELAIDDTPVDVYGDPRPRGLSQGHPSQNHQPGSFKDIFRRASISLRGMVQRRPSPSSGEAIHQDQPTVTVRPTTANSTWNRIRHPSGVRPSRSFYGFDFTHEPANLPQRPTHTSYAAARPGIGNEPPIIPESSGAAAKASAAMQNELFFRHGAQSNWLQPTTSEDENDVESGIGITVTAPEERASQISCVDFVTKLPVELAIHVLAYLDALALANASLVSTTWRRAIQSQHVWRESCLRETTCTFATSSPIQPDAGLGVPRVLPCTDWKEIYRVRKELNDRWKTGKARAVYLNGHTDSIYCLQFDEHKIITGSRDRTIRVWDLHTLKCQLVIGPPDIVNRKEFLVDSDGFLTHYAANSQNEKLLQSVPTRLSFPEHHDASILCLQYDDEILATGSSDGSCIIYDIQAGYRPIMRLRRHTAAVLDLAFDDKHIVTCSKDITICVWDRATGNLLHQLRGHKGPVNAVQMRGNTIVSCSGDCHVKLWNIDTGKNIREFVGHTKGLACSQFSEDGRYVASAGNDKAIRIWDANTGECVREMSAHKNLVRSLHIDSVSGRLISGSYDTDIKVWDMRTGDQLLDFPRWHTSWVLSAKSDYRRIISTGQDPKILIMDFGAEVEGVEMLESRDRYNGGFI